MTRRFLVGTLTTAGSGTASRPPSPLAGQQHWRTDKGFMETYDGTAWRVIGQVSVGALADITNPLTGQTALLTADNKVYRYTGSAWAPVFTRSIQQATSDLTLTQTITAVAGASLSMTVVAGVTGAVAEVQATFDWELTATGTGYCYGWLDVDGVVQSKAALFLANTLERRDTVMPWTITGLNAGTHTFTLKGQKDNNAGNAIHRSAGTQLHVELYQ